MTDDYVIEVGLDKRSSLDSLQQAVFAASLSGRKPMVVIVDTDRRLGQFEYRIRTAARSVGVKYVDYKLDYLIRMQMTEYFRTRKPAELLY